MPCDHNIPVATTTITYIESADVSAMLPEGAAQPRVVIRDRQCIMNARIRRAFPLSSAETYVSVQDGAGKEVGMLRSLDGLDAGSRKIFEEELDRRYFAPEISKIDMLKQDASMWKFAVQTQRGPAEFYVRNWRDSAHELNAGHWQITSVDGLRYDIPNLDLLDQRSQDLLQQVF